MMAMIREDLAALDIRHDVFFSERSLHAGPADQIAATIASLRARGPRLRGPPAAAQGPADRGLGGPRADPVPRDGSSATTSTGRC